MDTVAMWVLTFLMIVVLLNLANGTLRQWLAAKFLHEEPSS